MCNCSYLVCCFFIKRTKNRILIRYPKDKEEKIYSSVNSYEFDEDSLLFKSKRPDAYTEYTKKYNEFKYAVEDNNFFVLYSKENIVYIIGKNDITEGTPAELSDLLERKLGKKFKLKLR